MKQQKEEDLFFCKYITITSYFIKAHFLNKIKFQNMVHYSDFFLKMSPSRSPHCAPLDHVLYDQWKCCYKHLCVHTTDCKILDGNGKNSLRLLMRSRFPATSRHHAEVFSTKGHKALVIVISWWLSTPLECSHMCVKTATLKALQLEEATLRGRSAKP